MTDEKIIDSIFDHDAEVRTRDVIEVASDAPEMTSSEWHDYAMSKFADNELVEINGERYPNCYGLRRVAELLIGRIIESRPTQVLLSPDSTGNNPGRTTVVYQVTIESYGDNSLITVGDIAEVFSLNCDDLFLAYPGATAATRAEGRCLRKALKLRCVAAEELTRNKDVGKAVRDVIKSAPTDGTYKGEDPISDAQTKLLNNKCREMSIDVLKFINLGEKQYSRLDEVSKKTAINMIKLLNDYQNNSKTIPHEILGG